MPRRIERDLVWTSLCGLPVVLCPRALTARKTPKMYVPEERSLFVGGMWGSGRHNAGTSLSLQEEIDKEHRVQYTTIIIEISIITN